MVLQLVLQLILLFWSSNALLSPALPSLVEPGCVRNCGNITVPYPFGMGQKSCYFDEWFEIDCQNDSTSSSGGPRLLLKKANLEVLDILLPNITSTGMIRINSPIMYSNCYGSRKPVAAVDLRTSPFVFSPDENTFIAAGCNNRAVVESTGSALIGCTSSCSRKNSSNASPSSCSGVDCCQSTIPQFLQAFNVSFESTDGADKGKDGCKYAFLVDIDWFQPNSSSTGLSVVQELEYVPVKLEWGIPETPETLELMMSQRRNLHTNFWCYSTYFDSSSQNSSLQCYCFTGFEGNPYLWNGCQDINECENTENVCWTGSCKNTYGSFRCLNPWYYGVSRDIGYGFLAVFLVTGIWRLHKFVKKRKKIALKKKFFKRNGGLLLEQQPSSSRGNVEKIKVFTSKELEKATDHFNENRVLGQGGQGTVYKGMLPNGRIVAVKKSKIETELEHFVNEVIILSQINHRNVVKLLGCCLETEVPLLVYEFVPNGNLFQYLHDQNVEFSVSWEMRLQIAGEVAGAVSYLHSAASMPIYHRDIKSTNILLDDKYRAKVADFGTSRTISIDQTHLTTLVHGTFGYLDPAYFQSSQFTDKSDVYSFGVVLAELLTGQKPISLTRSEEDRSLVIYFIASIEENHLFDILDPQVAKQGHEDDIVAVANIAKKCLNLHGRNRPTMREVAMELERIIISRRKSNCQGNDEDQVDCVTSKEITTWDTLLLLPQDMEWTTTELH